MGLSAPLQKLLDTTWSWQVRVVERNFYLLLLNVQTFKAFSKNTTLENGDIQIIHG